MINVISMDEPGPMDSVDRYRKPIAFDAYVILPMLRHLLYRIAFGKFNRETWNKALVCYWACPNAVQNRVDWRAVRAATSDRAMCVALIFSLKKGLEEAGLLRDVRTLERGRL